MTLKVPKLRSLPFETEIIQQYRIRESSVEETMMEMYLAGVSVRRVEDFTEALWEAKVSPSMMGEMNSRIYEQIETWRNRPLAGEHSYVYLDGIWLKPSWGGHVENLSILVAIGEDEQGYRKVLGVSERSKEVGTSWRGFLRHLKERGFKGNRLFISEKCLGLLETLGVVYPDLKWQRCVVHFYRNVFIPVREGKCAWWRPC